MKIAICSDHRGYKFKCELVKMLLENEIECDDFGCFNEERCDYPVFAFKVGEAVKSKNCDYGVVICGSGDGVSIAVNKVKGVRCVVARNNEQVKTAKEHLNVNVLAFSAQESKVAEAFSMIKTVASTPFLFGRYEERVKMIENYEKSK